MMSPTSRTTIVLALLVGGRVGGDPGAAVGVGDRCDGGQAAVARNVICRQCRGRGRGWRARPRAAPGRRSGGRSRGARAGRSTRCRGAGSPRARTRQPEPGGSAVRVTGPLDDHHGGEVAGLLEPPPGPHVGDRVGAEHEEQLPTGRGERLQRVGGDRRGVALDLDGRGLDPVDVVDRGVDQREAVGRRRHHLAPLLPRVTGHHQQHPVEGELRRGLRRDHDVARRGRGRTCPRTPPAAPWASESTGARCLHLGETFASSCPVPSIP